MYKPNKPIVQWYCRDCHRKFREPKQKTITFRNEQEDWDCDTVNICPFCRSIYVYFNVIKM